ncbi:helicase POLQ-like [Scaptodrosophila lebanonensis]|uniref:Helicase POLQ-like n=1 Tax=Drosophila lebanonensis TaxID=7225 RepID=A0A6J2UCI7_DROLE|nr:helicase POLQ-like [Scaptodrosophila lebanonensis]
MSLKRSKQIDLVEDDASNAKRCTKLDICEKMGTNTDSCDSFDSSINQHDLVTGDIVTICDSSSRESLESNLSLFTLSLLHKISEETKRTERHAQGGNGIDLCEDGVETNKEINNMKELTSFEMQNMFWDDDEISIEITTKGEELENQLLFKNTIDVEKETEPLEPVEIQFSTQQEFDITAKLDWKTEMRTDIVCEDPQASENANSKETTYGPNSKQLDPEEQNLLRQKELEIIGELDWETQAFTEFQDIPDNGDFYGLSSRVKELIFEYKGIQSLYEWQDECLRLPAIRQRKNLIYALPTSGGKTLVAEILMLREMLCRDKNVLFVLPYVSIVQEKVSAMAPFAIDLDFIVDEYTAGKGRCPPAPRRKRRSLYIASIEKAVVLIDSLIEANRPQEIGLIVVDELHLIGERGRGASLEALLAKIMFLKASIQIVGMSATIGNINEISTFLNADVYMRSFRPVELKEYIKCGRDLLEINTEKQALEDIFVYSRTINSKYSKAVAREDPDHLAGLVTECAPENSCLIFCPTRKNCENVAQLLSRILPKKKFVEHCKGEKAELMDALDKICGVLSPVLARTLPYGIAYHHSGLTTDERKYIETAYRFGVISVICCTSTLAAGVNLPAKRVIIRAPYVGQEFITLCKYKQMVGRAGRAGMGDAGESILITKDCDNVKVRELLLSPMDKALSSLHHQNAVGLQTLILSIIGLKLGNSRRDLSRLIKCTLLSVQATELDVETEELVVMILQEMIKNNVLFVTEDLYQKSLQLTTDCRLFISQTTRFELTKIGRAAFKAGIDYKRAISLHKELMLAQNHLILSNYSHLLYLIVSCNSNEQGDEFFKAEADILFRLYSEISPETQALFSLLGFNEAHAAKLAKTKSIQGPLALQLNRLYKVLILMEILDVGSLPEVANKFDIERGTLQQFINQSNAAASALVRLCQEIGEFWCYTPLFERINEKMDRCGTIELEPLLELPAVKINRAKQLYAAGFHTIGDIAKIYPKTLVNAVEHMPYKIATEIIAAAKIILMKRLDHLEEETEALKSCLLSDDDTSND